MDANQQRVWMLSDRADWLGPGTEPAVDFDEACRRLRLRDRRPRRPMRGTVHAALRDLLVHQPARARDALGTQAWWSPTQRAILANGGAGADSEPIRIWPLPGDPTPANFHAADLAMGHDDALYVALHVTDSVGALIDGSVGLLDRRGRWNHPRLFPVDVPGFTPDRLAADPRGGVWVLDMTQRRVGRIQGLPLRDGLPPDFAPTTFRPRPENPTTPTFALDPRQPVFADATESVMGIACSPGGRLALWTLRPDGETWLQLRGTDGRWREPRQLLEAEQSVSAAWLSDTRLATLPAPREDGSRTLMPREALVYDLTDEDRGPLWPSGGFWPLRGLDQAPFAQGVTLPPHYPTTDGDLAALLPLSVATFEREGMAIPRLFDAQQDQATWHRVYLEAILPENCGVILDLAAHDDPDWAPAPGDWHPHLFGETAFQASAMEGLSGPWNAPGRGVWLKDRSELPHHAGLLGETPSPNRAGLFMALVQRPGRRVRALRGRYLHQRVRLFGTGHSTPELAAIRVHASRFSYRDHYLPELYREELVGSDADAVGRATRSDFLDRFLALFESALTPLEDRVAQAHLLTDPRSTPDEALDWLGSWIGVVFEPSFPADRRRAWLNAAPWLFQARGTLAGLRLALEIATGGRISREVHEGREQEAIGGGGVSSGSVLVLEDFRLRRTFATILGANLSLASDPLLPGLIVSANSRVGDALILGETEKVELLALFRNAFSSDPAQRSSEEAEVRAFYARLANRVTVFVHDAVSPVDFGLLARMAERESPAHVEVRVVRASHPLLVGLASLVDVDTYLEERRPPGRVQLDRSFIGEGDFIRRMASLDPRLGGTGTQVPAASAPPFASISGPAQAELGDTIQLSAAGSRASADHSLERFLWTPLSPGS